LVSVSEISDAIRAIGKRLNDQMISFGWSTSTPFSQTVAGGGIGISANTVVGYAEIVAARVERLTQQQLDTDGFGNWIGSILPELSQIQFNTMNQGHHGLFSNAMSVLQMIDSAIPNPPQKEPKVNWEDINDQKSLLPKDLVTRLRAIDVRLKNLDPKSKEIAKKISEIDDAHAAADQLPTDLAELTEKRAELSELITEAQQLSNQIKDDAEHVTAARTKLEEDISATQEKFDETAERAEIILAQSEHALRGATAVGLSKAFEARKKALARAGLSWTIGLAIALLLALLIGWERVTTLKDVLIGDKSSTVVVVNALLAVLGIGAPVWFAWLSTKQIGTTFRLAEDYAFKASVAQAYEGYRTEASSIDDQMRYRLFSAAMDRFEEAPMRLVDPNYHSSPLDEILNNPSIRNALNKVPNLAEKMLALISGQREPVTLAVSEKATSETIVASNEEDSRKSDAGAVS
jgi:hypothetical protein